MGITKLFSKYRNENNTSTALKYDHRRHSSISLFTTTNTIQQSKPNHKPRYSMAFEEDIKNRDSAIVSSMSGFVSVYKDESPDLATNTSAPMVNHDVQNVVQILRKVGSDLSIQRSPGHSNRQSKSKSVSLNGLKCTCHTPHIEAENKNRVSAPTIKMDSSNKYEVSVNRKGDQKTSENYIFGDIANLDGTLYSDLVTAQQQLQSVVNNSTPLVNKSIERVINMLAQMLEKSSYLESRLNTVIEVSKRTILHKAEQLKELEKQNESEKKYLSIALEDNKILKNRLTETEDLIKEIEHVLNENQIETTQEEGGTILQQIESLLAISTSSYSFNEKLTSELDNSDKRIQELLTQVDKLNITIANNQESQNSDEITNLNNKIMSLEEYVIDLNADLRSSKDAINRLDHEKIEENNQLIYSNNLLKHKISEMELYNNATIRSLENKNNRLREENMLLSKEKQSLISQQAATEKRNTKSLEIQKNDNLNEIEYMHILETKQSFLTESYMSNTEKPTGESAYDHSLAPGWKNNILYRGENLEDLLTTKYALEKNISDSIGDLQRTSSQSSTRSRNANKYYTKSLQSPILKDNTIEKNLEQTQEFEKVLNRSKCSIIEFPEKKVNNNDELLLPTSSGRHEMNVHIFEKQYKEYKTDDPLEVIERITQKYSNICMENSKVVQKNVKKKPDQLQQDMNKLSNSSFIPKAEKKSLEFEIKRKPTGLSKEKHITLDKKITLINNTEETKKSTYSSPLNNGFPIKIVLLSDKKTDVDKTKETPLEYQFELITSLQQENNTLHEILDCLQNKVKAITFGDNTYKLPDTNSSACKNLFFKGIENKEQEELLKMHTRAQLGLIEYLEGEDNVSLAISRFRKLLEIQMKDFEY